MIRWIGGIALLVLASAAAFILLPRSVPDLPVLKPLVIRHVTIIDPAAGAQPDMTVVVQGDRITSVTASSNTPAPPAALEIDGRGKFLIPGLWDMHIHGVYVPASRDFVQPLLVVNGVTGARVMASELRVDQISHQTEPGFQPNRLAPRTIGSGRTVNGPRGASRTSVVVQTPADGSAAIDSVLRSGGAFVKVFNNTPRAAYFALLRSARERGVRVTGHLPWDVDAAEASDSGQSIEHVTSIMRSCSAREAELRDTLVSVRGTPSGAGAEQRVTMYAAKSFDAVRCTRLAERFAANGTWLTPTLAALQRRTVGGVQDAAVRFIPDGERDLDNSKAWLAGRPTGERRNLEQQWLHAREIVSIMHRARTPLLAGTDAIAPTSVPGFSLHTELALLVSAGLTPAQALAAATSAPARYLGVSDTIGAIEAGKVADLVLLSANPLEDIRNTHRIEAVLLRGHFMNRDYLDGVLGNVRRRARIASWKHRIASITR